MPRLIGKIRKQNRCLFCAAFLIAIGIIFCWYPQWYNHVQKKTEPISSQTGTIEIARLVDAQIECEQEQNIWVNWSVLMAKGCSFEVRQNASGKGIYLNFGTMEGNIDVVSCMVNTSQPGSFIVYLIVWNSTSQVIDEILLTIQPKFEIIIRNVLLGVVGSVAVATNFTALVYWRKQQPIGRGRKLDRDWTLPVELARSTTKQDQLEDEIYLSTTVLVQMAFIQDGSLKILSVENFKEVQDPKVLQENALRLVMDQANQEKVKINQTFSLADRSFFLNYLRFADHKLAVVVISSKSLHQTFISTLRTTVADLLPTPNSANIDFTDLQLKINLILHLDRSRDYQIPVQSKIAILQKAPQWKLPLEEKEVITQGEMGQVQTDLEDMTLDEIQEMVKFLENGKQILKSSKEDVDHVEESRE